MSESSSDRGATGLRIPSDGHIGYVIATLFSADGRYVYYSDAATGHVHVWDLAAASAPARWSCHEAPVTELRRSPDGARLVTASLDGSVGVWSAGDGRLVRRLAGHRGGVHGLDVSERLIASGGFDGTLRVWATSGRPVVTFAAHDDTVTAVAFLSATLVVSASRDRMIRVWDVDRGECLRVLEGHRHWVTKLAALPDGRRVVSAGEDGTCRLWDVERGAAIWSGEIGRPIWGLGLAARGEFAITGSEPTRWDLPSGKPVRLPGAAVDRAVAISPDGAMAAFGTDRGEVILYDVLQGKVLQTCRARGDGGLAAAVDGGARHVATGHRDGSLTVRATAGDRRRIEGAHELMAYTLCAVGEHAFASAGFDGAVRLWDFRTAQPRARFEHTDRHVFSVSAARDGRQLLSAGSDAWCLWDLVSGREIARATSLGSGNHSVADLSADGHVIVSAGEDDRLRIWRPDGTLAAAIPHDAGGVSAVRLLPDGRRALLGDARGRVTLFDLRSGAGERLHESHEDWIRAVHATPDGRYAVSVSQNFRCRVYDLDTRRLLPLDALRAPIPAAAIAPGGEIVAVSALGDVLRVM